MKPLLLDLFCGAGGCSRGYVDAGFEVVGVDLKPQPHYPYEFIQGDALAFLTGADLARFKIIHASPVCKGYTELNFSPRERYERQIIPVRNALQSTGKPFVIENVYGAKSELWASLLLCGSMFDLQVRRHRLFECSHFLYPPRGCNHARGVVSVHGNSVWFSGIKGTQRKDGRIRPAIVPLEMGKQAMGIDWMNREELSQAIPPAYTEWIGRQLLPLVA